MKATRPELAATGPDSITADLETLLTRELGPRDPAWREPGSRYSTLRLQPVVLQPPPVDAASGAPWPDHMPSPDDDIDLGFDDDTIARRRQLLFAAVGVGIAIVGAAAYLIFGSIEEAPTARAPVPSIGAAPGAPGNPPIPVPRPPAEEAAAAPGQAVSDQSMGAVSTELVPPATDGLSPPRRIATTRIIVENDREVTAPR
jgi:hypothetical protein